MVGRFGGLPPVVILAVFFLVRGGGVGDGDTTGAGRLGGLPPVFILTILVLTGCVASAGAAAMPVSPVDAEDTTSTASPSFAIFFTCFGVGSSSTTTGPCIFRALRERMGPDGA